MRKLFAEAVVLYYWSFWDILALEDMYEAVFHGIMVGFTLLNL